MIRRLLAAVGRKVIGDAPAAERKVPGAAHAGHPDHGAPLSDVEKIAIAAGVLATRGPAWADATPLGVYRRAALDHAERQQLQADVEGMEVAHHDLLLVSGKSGTRIPDVLAMEATAYLEGEAR
jgi:hypothetical protein